MPAVTIQDTDTAWTVRIPRVRTARLVLREPRLADFEAAASAAADPLATAHLSGPLDRREAYKRLHVSAGGWVLQGMGWWTVELPDTGPIGSVGVFRRESGPDVEMGWIIHRAFWGRGFASEAAGAALGHAVETWRITRVIAHIGQGNVASIAVATKLGMRCEGEVDFYGDIDWRYAFGG